MNPLRRRLRPSTGAGKLRRFLALVSLLGALPALAGCFAPQPPALTDYSSVPVRAFTVPLPVRPDGNGRWSLAMSAYGIIGQGRSVARIDRDGRVLWKATLPAEFALTAPTGRPHSATPVTSSRLLLVGGAAAGRMPALAALSLADGRLTRLAAPPVRPRGRLENIALQRVGASGVERILAVATTCAGPSCTLTGWDATTGRVDWTVRSAGAASLTQDCLTPNYAGFQSDSGCFATVAVTGHRLAVINPETGALRRTTAVLPRGDVAHVVLTLYRIVVITAPRGPGCAATAAAYDREDPSGKPVWRRDFHWQQPQAAPDQATGCRYDPSIPLMLRYDLTLPETSGALVMDDYSGTVHARLRPGEYPVQYQAQVVAHRADGTYRDPYPDSVTPTRPRLLVPEAVQVANGMWWIPPAPGAPGRVLALDLHGGTRWQRTTAGPVLLLDRDRLVYCEGSRLVGLRAAT